MKILITALKIATSAKGNEYARISFVNLSDGSVAEAFVDPGVVRDCEAVDLSDLESFGDEVLFDQKGKITHVG